jgi:hypothetical protein
MAALLFFAGCGPPDLTTSKGKEVKQSTALVENKQGNNPGPDNPLSDIMLQQP